MFFIVIFALGLGFVAGVLVAREFPGVLGLIDRSMPLAEAEALRAAQRLSMRAWQTQQLMDDAVRNGDVWEQ